MAYHITRGMRAKPTKAVTYGPEGVGKTVFGSHWHGAVFIDIEDGSGHYDVARFPRPTEWLGLLAEVNAAADMPEVGTLVIDTLDAAETLCIKHVLTVKKWSSIEDAGYGKGYTYLADEFAKLFVALDKVIDSGKNVLLLAHAQIKKFEQPDEMGAYDRWELKLQKKCSPIVKEWCDLLLFANFKNDMMKDEQTKKYKATGGRRRVMYASHTAAYDAKNRLELPDEMPFDFESIKDKVFDPSANATEANTNAVETASIHDDENEAQAGAEAAAKAAQPTQQEMSDYLHEIANGNMNAKPPVFDEVTEPEIQQLHQLMEDSGVNEAQLRDAVASRANNDYTIENTIADYSIEFVRNTLLKHWDKIVATVSERGELYSDVPF